MKMALERTYNIPLRKHFRKAPKYKKTNRAVSALRSFLSKHMKSEDVKLGKNLNQHLWKQGIRNPPHHVKVTAIKDDEGVVRAELFGHKYEEPTKEELEQQLQEKEKKPKKTPEKKEELEEKPRLEEPKKAEAVKQEKPEAKPKLAPAKTEKKTEPKPKRSFNN